MPKLKTKVTLEMYTEGFVKEFEEFLDDKCMKIANNIKNDAKTTTAFIDKSGRLRASVKRRKSKFDGGGYMVKAGGKGAMQAWLIEHGHGGLHPAAPHPFLKPALDRNIQKALNKFNEAMT